MGLLGAADGLAAPFVAGRRLCMPAPGMPLGALPLPLPPLRPAAALEEACALLFCRSMSLATPLACVRERQA